MTANEKDIRKGHAVTTTTKKTRAFADDISAKTATQPKRQTSRPNGQHRSRAQAASKVKLHSSAAILALLLLAWFTATPALAQTCPANSYTGSTQIWTATLTVGAATSGGTVAAYGYIRGNPAVTNAGSLSDTTFEIGSNSYTFQAFIHQVGGTQDGELTIDLSAALTADQRASLRLHICGETYDFSDATYITTGHIHSWPDADLDWSSATTLNVALSRRHTTPRLPDDRITCGFREHAPVGYEVCSADEVRATDADGDTPTYTLEGEDASGFEIDSATGRVTLGTASSDFDDNTFRCVSGRTPIEACYDITIRASDPDGRSDTMAIFARVLDMPNLSGDRDSTGDRLTAPTNLTAESTTSGVRLSWTASSGSPDGYRIDYTTNRGRDFWTTLVADTNSTSTTYTDSSALQDVTRHYRVAGRKDDRRTLSSNIASGRMLYGPQPRSLRQTEGNPATNGMGLSLLLTQNSRATPAAELFEVRANNNVVTIENVYLLNARGEIIDSSALVYITTAPVSISTGDRIEVRYTDPRPGVSDSFRAPAYTALGPQVIETTGGIDASSFCLTINQGESAALHTCQGRPATATAETPEPDDTTATELTAEFLDLPLSHTGDDLTFELRFSQTLKSTFSYSTWSDLLTLRGASFVKAVRTVKTGDERNRRWDITVSPNSATQDVSITLSPPASCDGASALCTDGGTTLSYALTRLVPPTPDTTQTIQPQSITPTPQTPQTTPLTVAYTKTPPAEHNGQSGFTFEFAFSENLKSSYGFSTMRDHSLSVQQGGSSLTPHVKRKIAGGGNNQAWIIKVTPSGYGDITVSLDATPECSAQGAMCTEDDRGLSSGLTATTIEGPRGFSVADSQATEGTDSSMDFTLTLSRADTRTVTVNYATSDGTATAGADYTAKSGSLTFAAGDTSKTVSVPILADVVDDDGETFTLTLSNNSGGNTYLADDTATGTISNTGAMPKAWLSRFGRTAAIHALDAVEDRLASPGTEESWVRLGGHQLHGLDPHARETLERMAPRQSLWDNPENGSLTANSMTPQQLLLESAFHLVGNAEDRSFGPRLSAWGRASTSSFDGQDGTLNVSGSVTTATLGVDVVWSQWLTGLAVAYSHGDGSFSHPQAAGGDIRSSLTSVHPYLAYALSERVRIWGMAGHGSGSLELAMTGQDPLRTDLDMTMGAFGIRGTVLRAQNGLELAVRSDYLWVSTGSEGISTAAGNMAAADTETTRLRLVLEGSRRVVFEDGGVFTPTLEVALRNDAGDADEGNGVEAGGRLAYTSPSGLSISVSMRALLAHEAGDYQEWGAGASLRYDPGQKGLGLTAALSPTWGIPTSGVGRLWSQPEAQSIAGAAGIQSPQAQTYGELGYGLKALKGQGILTPYARASFIQDSESAWHLGTRLAIEDSLNLSLEATHRQQPYEQSAQELTLLGTVTW